MASNAEKCRILFLAANPTTAKLKLDLELREVREAIALSSAREAFAMESRGAVRWRDLRAAVLDYKPHVLHFSGHGSRAGELILEDESGGQRRIQPEALNALFGAVQPDRISDPIELVILNACFSRDQADAIAAHVDHVVGMSSSITDEGAIAFARAFYDALSSGSSISGAFGVARSEIIANRLPDRDVPQHIIRPIASSHLRSLEVARRSLPVSGAPQVVSINQKGGQTAHTINNYGPPRRTITPDARSRMRAILSQIGPQSAGFSHTQGDRDAEEFKLELMSVFQQAGWHVRDGYSFVLFGDARGIQVVVPPDMPEQGPLLQAVVAALSQTGERVRGVRSDDAEGWGGFMFRVWGAT